MKGNHILIRPLLLEEYPFMEKIMYEAVYQPDPANPYPREVIYLPEVRKYWDNWGEGKDDYCLLAVSDNELIGAVWIRSLHGYGHIDDQTPEIAIALFEPYRNKGMGTRMMQQMIVWMKSNGYSQVSLSITKGNPAIHLYERLGFQTVDENKEDYIMLLKFS